jgi:hypothetical protein
MAQRLFPLSPAIATNHSRYDHDISIAYVVLTGKTSHNSTGEVRRALAGPLAGWQAGWQAGWRAGSDDVLQANSLGGDGRGTRCLSGVRGAWPVDAHSLTLTWLDRPLGRGDPPLARGDLPCLRHRRRARDSLFTDFGGAKQDKSVAITDKIDEMSVPRAMLAR